MLGVLLSVLFEPYTRACKGRTPLEIGDPRADTKAIDPSLQELRHRNGRASPRLIPPEGVDTVVEVVPVGDRREHPPDAIRLVGGRVRVASEVFPRPRRGG